MPRKILLVEDDPAFRKATKKFLEKSGFLVIQTDTGSEALILVKESCPDLLLVDVNLPGLDGKSLCRMLRGKSGTRSIPIIFMSGMLIDERDIVTGLKSGGDDYLVKPFSPPILLARIEALLRRAGTKVRGTESFGRCGIRIDPGGRRATCYGKPIKLTRKEFDLLALLVSRAGHLLRVPYLLETIWGYDPAQYNNPGTVEVHISHLRKKLGPKCGKYIVNVVGHGYKFQP